MVPQRKCAKLGCKIKEHLDAGNLSVAALDGLQRVQKTLTYRRGETIFVQGEDPAGLYCLRSGNVLLSHVDAFDHRTGFRVASQGEIIGYRSLFGDDVHAATARALATTDVCFYPREVVFDTIEENPTLALSFLRTVARDRGPPDGLILRGQHLPVRIRLANLLLVLRDDFSQTDDAGVMTFQLPLTRRDIASLLSARPESITRAIAELKRDSIAVFNGRLVSVPDFDRLSKLASGAA